MHGSPACRMVGAVWRSRSFFTSFRAQAIFRPASTPCFAIFKRVSWQALQLFHCCVLPHLASRAPTLCSCGWPMGYLGVVDEPKNFSGRPHRQD